MFKKEEFFGALMIFGSGSVFAGDPDSVALMRKLVNSKEFADAAHQESAKGFPLLNSLVVANDANCLCYVVNATFQKTGSWPDLGSEAANTDVVRFVSPMLE